MRQSYISVFFHWIWTTKNRERWFSESGKKKLYGYIKSIIKKEDIEVVAIGGTADHVHLLIRTHTLKNMDGFIRRIKSASSGFVNRMSKIDRRFEWQIGYGLFSVSSSDVTRIKRYIWNQEEHHKKITFEKELESFGVPSGGRQTVGKRGRGPRKGDEPHSEIEQ